MPLFFWIRSAATLLVVGALSSSCAWHRVGPAQVERQLSPRLDLAVGLEPADGDTVASDVEVIAKHWTRWGAFRAVQFPVRSGDPVDLVVDVRLRQTSDLHLGSNLLKSFLIGLSLYALSPVLGRVVSEIHDVRIQCRQGETTGAPISAELRTDVEFGQGVDSYMVAKALDDAQMEQVAAWALQTITSECRFGRATSVSPAQPIQTGL